MACSSRDFVQHRLPVCFVWAARVALVSPWSMNMNIFDLRHYNPGK